MDIINSIFGVFTKVGDWIVEAIESFIPIFYTAPVGDGVGQLTFIGTVTVCGLAISIAMLLFNVVKNFLRFR